eukprot:scaffold40265_cov39-Tisochrysis_lutea.AAC.3
MEQSMGRHIHVLLEVARIHPLRDSGHGSEPRYPVTAIVHEIGLSFLIGEAPAKDRTATALPGRWSADIQVK